MMYTGQKVEDIVRYIQEYIESQHLKPGDRLPGENEIAQTLQVSRVTVRRALSNLQESNRIYSVHGKGSFVQAPPQLPLAQTIVPVMLNHDERSSRILEILSSAQQYFYQHDIQTTMSISNRDAAQEKRYITDYFDRGARCALVLPVSCTENNDFYREIMQKGMQIVFIDRKPVHMNCHYVGCDNFQGAFDAVWHLIQQGHRRIGFFTYERPDAVSAVSSRLEGYRVALAKAGIPFDPKLVVCVEEFAGMPEVNRYFLEVTPSVTAIFCVNDMGAIEISNRMAAAGVKIPGQMAIVGFDNLSIAQQHYPSLSTVDQPFAEIGRQAAELACRLMDGSISIGGHTVTLPVQLIVRESSACRRDAGAAPLKL